jgi:hypothetical protein
VDSFFWWQCIGGGLMTVAPAVTYSLKVLIACVWQQEGNKTLQLWV